MNSLHLHHLCHHHSHRFQIQFHIWFIRWLLYAYFTLFWRHRTLFFLSLFQIAFILLIYLTAKRFSSYTPATASCKEILLVALHDLLLMGLLDIWEQKFWCWMRNWSGICWTSQHWRCEKKYLMFPSLKFHCQLYQYVYRETRPIYGMGINDIGICVC